MFIALGIFSKENCTKVIFTNLCPMSSMIPDKFIFLNKVENLKIYISVSIMTKF
jgi:hypothetical protein